MTFIRVAFNIVAARLAFRSIEFFYVAQPSSYDVERTPALTGVTSFEAYVSDVIGRRFEKVKTAINLRIGGQFEDWTSIRGWTSI
jgi:hypothetical protein